MHINKKWLWALLIPPFVYLMIYLARYAAIDSDYASLVLEANDILHGNLFLKGWNLTGVSFISTDLLFFTVGAIFKRVSPETYYIAVGLMVSCAVILGFLLCEPGKREKKDWLFYFMICGVPCTFAMSILRAHTGAVCWSFLALLLLNRDAERRAGANVVVATLALTLGCFGDSVTVLVAVAPLALWYLMAAVRADARAERVDALKKLGCVLAALVAGTLLDKLYFIIGGANKNSFFGDKIFEPLENWGNKFNVLIHALFGMTNADFFGQKLASLSTVGYFANTLIVITGAILAVRSVWCFLTKKDADFICAALSLGMVIICAVFVITNISVDVTSSRYISYILIANCVLIVRSRRAMFDAFKLNRRALAVVYLAVAVASLGFRLTGLDAGKLEAERAAEKGLGQFLQANGLTNGYANFINGSITTVLSEDAVKVRGIYYNGKVNFYNWFCKNEWYQEPASFVVTTDDDDRFGIKQDIMVSQLGEPVSVLEFAHYRVLVYDGDLSDKLQVNCLMDGVIEAREMYANPQAVLTEDGFQVNPGGILFGPYGKLDKGSYTLTYSGDNVDCLDLDAYSQIAGPLSLEAVSRDDSTLVYKLTVPQNLTDIELREYNNSGETAVFDAIAIAP